MAGSHSPPLSPLVPRHWTDGREGERLVSRGKLAKTPLLLLSFFLLARRRNHRRQQQNGPLRPTDTLTSVRRGDSKVTDLDGMRKARAQRGEERGRARQRRQVVLTP